MEDDINLLKFFFTLLFVVDVAIVIYLALHHHAVYRSLRRLARDLDHHEERIEKLESD